MSEQPYFTIYGEDWNYESNTNGIWVDRESFDTLAQRLQEAERLLGSVISQFKADQEIRGGIPTRWKELLNESDAFLAGKGDKP